MFELKEGLRGWCRAIQTILRYVRVNSVQHKTVSVTGVNPPTGKHVDFVFEQIDNDKVLDSLKYAFCSKLFIKFLAGTKGEPDFEFQEEKTAANREDSYFTLFSYCSKVGYNPLFLRELDHHLVTMDSYTGPIKEIGRHLLNVTDKLGNVFYSKSQIVALNPSAPFFAEIRYHVTTAVVSCRACLDALAAILNEVYSIGYSKGRIDLSTERSDLLHKVSQVNGKLGSVLRKYESWINELTEMRDFVVHRIMILTPPVGRGKTVSGVIEPVKCRVPASPLTVGDPVPGKIQWTDAEDYCESLIVQMKAIVEIVCEDLLQLIKSNTYHPI